MSLFSGSNNKYSNLPPIMADGRNYSNWQPETIINEQIKNNAGIKSNWEYREYLQKNANQIMKYNHLDAINSSGNNPTTYLNNNSSNNSPFIFNSTHDSRKPCCSENDSDLKKSYLSREQLNARMFSPSISTKNF
jgi:hypothetical protein